MELCVRCVHQGEVVIVYSKLSTVKPCSALFSKFLLPPSPQGVVCSHTCSHTKRLIHSGSGLFAHTDSHPYLHHLIHSDLSTGGYPLWYDPLMYKQWSLGGPHGPEQHSHSPPVPVDRIVGPLEGLRPGLSKARCSRGLWSCLC